MQRPSRPQEQHGSLHAVSAQKKEQDIRLKSPMDQGVIKSMAIFPKFHKHGKRLAVEEEKRNGKESTLDKQVARRQKTPQEGSSQGNLMLSKPQEYSSLAYTPITWQQQSVISYSLENHGPYARPKRYSSVIVQNRAFRGPHLLETQVPNATNQDTVASALEWQRKLEAAEALLALRNSPLPPPVSTSPQQHSNMPNSYLPGHGPQGSARVRGLQRYSPYLPPRSTNSISLAGSLEYMPFFT